MQHALDEVIGLLDLEPIEVNIFRGVSPEERRQRVFGGQVAGQALVAAARTVEDRQVHSLHAYFLRPGDPAVPILYEVDRIRDGRSFTTRRVVAIQHGRAIFHMSASFHAAEGGWEHQIQMPAVASPESLPDVRARYEADPDRYPDDYPLDRPIDIRYVTADPWVVSDRMTPEQLVWMRANGTIGDDPVLHTCLLTYASDMTLLDTTILTHGKRFTDPDLMMASLDHAMWFHRPFRADEWFLYVQESPSSGAGRGMARGLVFTHDGALVASVAQEGLVRDLNLGRG